MIIYAVTLAALGNPLFCQSLHITNLYDGMKFCNSIPLKVEWVSDSTENFNINIKCSFNHFTFTPVYSLPSKTGYAEIDLVDGYLENKINSITFYNSDTKEVLAQVRNIELVSPPEFISEGQSEIECNGRGIYMWAWAVGYISGLQWYHNGVKIENATSRTYNIKHPSSADSGYYQCEAFDTLCGNIWSKIFYVYLNGPDIVSQPKDEPMILGKTAHFKAGAHLTPEDEKHVRFQWWRDSLHSQWLKDPKTGLEYLYTDTFLVKMYDGKKYAGVNSDYLSVNMTTYGDVLEYFCQVITDKGCTFTKPAEIRHWLNINLLTQNSYPCEGEDFEIKVEVPDFKYEDLIFEWRKTGNRVLEENEKFQGTKTNKLTIKNLQQKDMAAYYCQITYTKNGYWRNSNTCFVSPDRKPRIIYQTKKWVIKNPPDFTLKDALFLVFSTDNLTESNYNLYHNGIVVDSGIATKVVYLPYYTKDDPAHGILKGKFREATPADTGDYVCKFWNNCGVTWSDTSHVYWGDEDTLKGIIKPDETAADIYDRDDDPGNTSIANAVSANNSASGADIIPHLYIYPNPSSDGATIYLRGRELRKDTELEIYNPHGELISVLHSKIILESETGEFYWNGQDINGNSAPSGVYFARINSCRGIPAIKIVLVK